MYIRINDEFLTRPDDLVASSLAISNLLSAFVAGHHHLVISRELSDEIVDRCDLSVREKNALISLIKSRYTISASELRTTFRYIDCVPDGSAVHPVNNAIVTRLRHFDDPMNAGATRVLVEDVATDGEALLLLLDLFSRFFFPGRRRSLNLVHGGGARLATVFKHEYVSPRPIVCVADSDSRYPGGPLGRTAASVLAVHRHAPFATALVEILPVREMENAIPLRLIRLAYEDSGAVDVCTVCQSLVDFCETDPHDSQRRACFTAFLDLKSGLKATDVTAMAPTVGDVLAEFWQFRTKRNPIPETNSNEFLDCDPFAGIAENILAVVTRTAADKPFILNDLARNLRKHPFGLEISGFINRILDLCAAPPPTPVRLAA